MTNRLSPDFVMTVGDRTIRGILVFSWADNVAFGAAFAFLAVYMDEKVKNYILDIVFASP